MAASKQLEIILHARDEASSTFKKVGGEAGGLHSHFEALNQLAEAGHGIKNMLRNVEHIFIAFEAANIGVAAFRGILGALSGDVDQAAAGEKAFLDTIRELPVVGSKAADALEALGNKFHLLSINAAEARDKITGTFLTMVPEIESKLKESKFQVDLIGLSPTDASIEKAKQDYQKAIEALKPEKKTLQEVGRFTTQGLTWDDAGRQVAMDKQQAIADDDDQSEEKREAARKKVKELQLLDADEFARRQHQLSDTENNYRIKRDADIAKIRADARLVEYQRQYDAFTKSEELAKDHADKLKAITDDINLKQLQANNRGYEAQLATLGNNLDKQIEAIKAAKQKQFDALNKENITLAPKARAGDRDAQDRIKANTQEIVNAQLSAEAQIAAARKDNGQDKTILRDNQLRTSKLDILRQEAASGDALAKVDLDRLTTSRQQEATENALQAIAHDTLATKEQQAKAEGQLVLLKRAQEEATDYSLESSELAILQQKAQLGDVSAGIQAQQIENSRKLNDQAAQLLGILSDQKSTDEQRLEAKRQLAQLKEVGAQQQGAQVRDSGLFILQQEAALGDKIAEQQLKKLQIEKEFGDEKQKLLAVLKSDSATAQEKADAKKELSGLDAVENRAIKQLKAGDHNQQIGANLTESHHLTGVTAARNEYAPVIDAANRQTNVTQSILTVLTNYFGGGKQSIKVVPLK